MLTYCLVCGKCHLITIFVGTVGDLLPKCKGISNMLPVGPTNVAIRSSFPTYYLFINWDPYTNKLTVKSHIKVTFNNIVMDNEL
jgi:hypothetical protein